MHLRGPSRSSSSLREKCRPSKAMSGKDAFHCGPNGKDAFHRVREWRESGTRWNASLPVQKKEAALAGGFREKHTNIDYFRRRKINSAAAPRPASANVLG